LVNVPVEIGVQLPEGVTVGVMVEVGKGVVAGQ
jgi:hypothetical protein